MAVDSKRLLGELKQRVKVLEDDLRARSASVPEMAAELRTEYGKGREAGRIGEAFESWRDGVLTQAAVHWVLGCVFVRFLEDNGLIAPALLAGAKERGREAAEQHAHYFQQPGQATHSDRHYLLHVFGTVAALPAGERLFDQARNPVWRFPVSADAARDLLAFWRRVDPNTGELSHDFEDDAWDTRFLGDLYQDLSEAAKKTYALLQTPVFVEEFILDRTLEPAIREFGLAEVKLIDPTCGSGHFLLGAFDRLIRRWQMEEPATNERVLVQRALDAVNGVDLNPFAVAIARFRLLIAALKASDVKRLAQAPDFKLHIATGDSLLFGTRRDDELALGNTAAELKTLGLAFHMEDAEEADRILSQRYHAVVGNPPYIAVEDAACRETYRRKYPSCHMRYTLSVPFIERFWQLAYPGSATNPAGFVGMINANAFMKREFGKKVVEQFFTRVDLTHVIDTAWAYIPGHNTSTTILFGRNRGPVSGSIRSVMGIKGETGEPANPSQGRVWTAIVEQVDAPGTESDFITVSDTPRESFSKHPWSIGGGGAADLKESVEAACDKVIATFASQVGITAVTGEDEVYILDSKQTAQRLHVEAWRALVTGDLVREWGLNAYPAVWLYDDEFRLVPLEQFPGTGRYLWVYRAGLSKRKRFGTPMLERGLTWFEYQELYASKLSTRLTITFGEVATHNHFVLDRNGAVFKNTAPVIKLSADASEHEYLALLGLLNSSSACFWLKQVCFPKGGDQVGNEGARVRKTVWDDRYAFNATNVGQFPVPSETPLDLAILLDAHVQSRQLQLPTEIAELLPASRTAWHQHRAQSNRLLRKMIALQEELDWRCYRLYGITQDELTYRDAAGEPLTPPEINLGERAFEIVLARRVRDGEEETTWFQRHGSTPITALPAHWPADYRALVERRIERILKDRYVGLVERPEYKRRWNTEPWDQQAPRALEEWLKTRLEDPRYWPEPRLQTTHTLAEEAQYDADFMAVAELYRGHAGFDVHALVRELVEAEAVPFLPVLRYKESGRRKREVWERTWELQRREDAIDAALERELAPVGGESEQAYRERIAKEQKRRKQADPELRDIPRPPRYSKEDFLNATYWGHRGALDVPKERFISYPHGSRDNDPSLTVGWAGWNHLEQAQALASWINHGVEYEAWSPERLTPLLAGIAELVPWLKQWHNEPTPEFGPLGDFFDTTYLDDQLHRHGLTRADLQAWTPPAAPRGRRKKGAGV
ncbi:MAG TPA: BREX-2 system adenine-specific DNA-methyltransferase PglX [Longimicrobium sp.]